MDIQKVLTTGVMVTLTLCIMVALLAHNDAVQELESSTQLVADMQKVLDLFARQIAELEGQLRVCEMTIGLEDSCCAIQSRCLERNAQLERLISDCSTVSPTE